jgi:mannose-6-phosphate isomerase-like protein (cupin superfamily)
VYGIPPATFAAQRTNLQEVRTNLQDLPSSHRIDRVVTHKEFSMVKIGDQIENPLSGERFVFLTTVKESHGRLLRMQVFVPPGRGPRMPPHLHPAHRSRFVIHSGNMQVVLNAQMYGPGDQILIPIHVPYNWHVTGKEALCFTAEFEPAGEWAAIFESTCTLGRDQMAGKRRNVVLASAVLLNHYRDHLYISGMSIPMQKCVFALLAFVGRRLGYQHYYSYA